MWKQKWVELASTKRFAVVAASAMSAVAGAAVGATVAMKQLEKKYAEIAEKEIEDAKVFYARRNKTGEFADLAALAAPYAGEEEVVLPEDDILERESAAFRSSAEKLVERLNYQTAHISEAEPTPLEKAEVDESLRKNVFEVDEVVEEGEFDLEAEKLNRSPDRAYVISEEEYLENETDYDQTTLTYFEGDDVLVDEADAPIRNLNLVVGGMENLSFGYGSGNKDTVFIRNDALQTEFEVARSDGKYAEEVLGFIEHADKPRPRKFRDYD